MKRLIPFILCFYFSNLIAQNFPALFNYQVSIRDDNGDPISDRMVSFKIYILENKNDTLNAAYREEHKDVSTKFGTASFMIGDGTNLKNSLMAVPFHLKTFFIKVQIDQNNGTQYKDFVTTQLISVPYAMVASQLSQNNATTGQVLKWNGVKWTPGADSTSSNSGASDLKGDVTGTPANNKVEKIQNRNVATTNPLTGQVLKWNGFQWAPSDDQGGTPSGDAGGDLTGKYPIPVIRDGVVSSNKIADNAITNSKIANNAITDIKIANGTISGIKLNQMGAKDGQVLKWLNGSGLWWPGDDLGGSSDIWTKNGDVYYNFNNKRFLISNSANNTLDFQRSVNNYPGIQARYEDRYVALGFELTGNPFISLGHSSAAFAGIRRNTGNNKYDIYADGQKSFVLKHPYYIDSLIVYSCIEGPEAAAYERGTSKMVNGRAEVNFSEHFGLIINSNTMTINLTPISLDSKGLAIISRNKNGFIVGELFGGTGNYEFDWEVKAVRKEFENNKVIRHISEYQISPEPPKD
jgi:hypothetical protein